MGGLLNYLPKVDSDKVGWPWSVEVGKEEYSCNINWPKITIVTPSYNQGCFIEETIRSILLQNYPNLEYIIFDAESTDDTIEILKKYSDYLTYWKSEKDNGQTDAIKKGLNITTGTLFNWINSDDFLQPNALLVIALAYINNSNIDILTGTTINISQQGEYISKFHFNTQRLIDNMLFDVGVNQPGSFWRTDLVLELGLNSNLHYIMDLDIWFRYLYKYGKNNIYLLNHDLASFRLHTNSKTVSMFKKFNIEEFAIYMVYFSNVIIKSSPLFFIKNQFNEYFKKIHIADNKILDISLQDNLKMEYLLLNKLLTQNMLIFSILEDTGMDKKDQFRFIVNLPSTEDVNKSNALKSMSLLKFIQSNKLITIPFFYKCFVLNKNKILLSDLTRTFFRNFLFNLKIRLRLIN